MRPFDINEADKCLRGSVMSKDGMILRFFLNTVIDKELKGGVYEV